MGIYDEDTQEQKSKLEIATVKANRRSNQADKRLRIKQYSDTNKIDEFVLSEETSSQINRFRDLTNPPDNYLENFRYTTDDLLKASRETDIKHNGNVTDFSGWVYSLYKKQASPSTLARNTAMETNIDRAKEIAKFEKETSHDYRMTCAEATPGWKLKYKHFADEDSSPLRITDLQSSGYDFFGKPDLVFKNKKGEILIVEIKMTQANVPKNGWPNIGAQLWSYAHADVFKDAPKIHLAAEVYRAHFSWKSRKAPQLSKVCIAYDFYDQTFQENNKKLFDRFTGLLR